jgi:hypothetical protein
MIVRLHLAGGNDGVRGEIRFGWLFLSLGLLLMSGFFLYPVVESFTKPEAIAPIRPTAIAETTAAQPAAPVKQVVNLPKKQAPAAAQAVIPAKPIRETAPTAPEGIRNRIEGVIPVDVTLRIGPDGAVVSAHAPAQYDSVRSYFAQQAVAAARQWRFRPARVGQETVASQWTVRFRFYRSGVMWD